MNADVQLKVLEKLAEMEETMTIDGLYNSMQLYLGQRLVAEGLVKGNNLKAADILGYVAGGAIRDTPSAPPLWLLLVYISGLPLLTARIT